MAWEATASKHFSARHAASHADEAAAVLDALEHQQEQLIELFPRVPDTVTVVLHDSTAQLLMAQPWLAVARRFSSTPGRRYMAGWFSRSELHVLAPSVLRRTAAGEDSLRAMLLTPQRYLVMLTVGTNNPLFPPPFRPASMSRLLRHAWQLEGAGQFFSGQLPHLRAAIAVRMRGSSVPLPPSARDAALLGGTVYDLLAQEQGMRACVRLACHPDNSDAKSLLESAFGVPRHELTQRWRSHLERTAEPEPHVKSLEF